MPFAPFTDHHRLDWEALVANLRRRGTPRRVHFMELFQDREVEDAIDRTYGVTRHLDRGDPAFEWQRSIAMQRFLGYEYVMIRLLSLPLGDWPTAADTTGGSQARTGRTWLAHGRGPITTWEEFERYPWPDGETWDTRALEWFDRNLPDDMCLGCWQGHLCEHLTWLMGYETLCEALFERRDLVAAIAEKLLALEEASAKVLLQSRRVRLSFPSDDMGFKTGLMLSPADLRAFVLNGHRRLAALARAAGAVYVLHCCGKRAAILEDLIADVKVDALQSWEDGIELITDAKRAYGDRVSLVGGLDVDVLCRASEEAIRAKVREVVKACQPGGGFCLGSGNTVANYIPMDHYLAMLDEGRKL